PKTMFELNVLLLTDNTARALPFWTSPSAIAPPLPVVPGSNPPAALKSNSLLSTVSVPPKPLKIAPPSLVLPWPAKLKVKLQPDTFRVPPPPFGTAWLPLGPRPLLIAPPSATPPKLIASLLKKLEFCTETEPPPKLAIAPPATTWSSAKNPSTDWLL